MVAEATPGVKVIVFPAFTIGVASDTDFDSALVEVIVQVETPVPFVTEQVL